MHAAGSARRLSGHHKAWRWENQSSGRVRSTVIQSGRMRAIRTMYRVASHSIVIAAASTPRSEEHTSELQSHSDLVCRLLLEKKNNSANHHNSSDIACA